MTKWAHVEEMAVNAQSNTLDLGGQLGSQKPECSLGSEAGWNRNKDLTAIMTEAFGGF